MRAQDLASRHGDLGHIMAGEWICCVETAAKAPYSITICTRLQTVMGAAAGSITFHEITTFDPRRCSSSAQHQDRGPDRV
jgi:hypothetical protein